MLQIKACFFMGASVTQRQMTQRKKFVLNYILSLALFQVMTKNRIYPLVSDPTLILLFLWNNIEFFFGCVGLLLLLYAC